MKFYEFYAKMPKTYAFCVPSSIFMNFCEPCNNEHESFISSLKEIDVSYITHSNINKEHLYRDGLNLNRIGYRILAEIFVFYPEKYWLLKNQTWNQSITNEENSSRYQTENSDKFTKGLTI